MAGAKGEKGDDGKPGVTPLDSCDRVRVDFFLVETFSASLDDCPYPESYQLSLMAQLTCLLLCFDKCKMATPSFCIVSKFAWRDVRSSQSDRMPAVITYSLVCFQCLERLQREQATEAVVSRDHS